MKKITHFMVRTYFSCYVDVTIKEFNVARKTAKINNIPYYIDVDKENAINFVMLCPLF